MAKHYISTLSVEHYFDNWKAFQSYIDSFVIIIPDIIIFYTFFVYKTLTFILWKETTFKISIYFFFVRKTFGVRVRVLVLNTTYNNISVISWQSLLLVEETRRPGENHRPVASHWQTLSHNVVSSTPHQSGVPTHKVSGDRHWLRVGPSRTRETNWRITGLFYTRINIITKILTWRSSFILQTNERNIDGIISFAHVQVNVTDFSIGSINCVRHFLQT